MSIIHRKLLNFDTINGIPNFDNVVKLYHTWNTTIPSSYPITRVKRVSLKSAEIPLGFNTCRNENKSIFMYLQFTYGAYTNQQVRITIPENTYTSTTSLINAINSSLTTQLALYGGVYITFSLNLFSILKGTTNATAISFYQDSILTKNIMGYSDSIQLVGGNFTAASVMNLSPDNYLNIYLTNLGQCSNASGTVGTFKIPLPLVASVNSAQILFYNENTSFEQSVEITDGNFTLSNLTVIITDRWGYPIIGRNTHFSFTLMVEHL